VSSAGQEAVELAASVGLELDPWQQLVLDEGLGERMDGRWSAFEIGVMVSRQNGKGGIIEARQLAGLFLFDEQLIMHSAHEFKTAQEAFRRILTLIQNAPDLERRVMRVRTSHGEEGIELRSGQRLRFLARSRGSGRGFSGDCLFLDEAMILGDPMMAALMPTMSARPNPQLWYFGSAGEQDSVPFGRIRRRGVRAADPDEDYTDESLAYFEWSADVHEEFCERGCDEHLEDDDPRGWAQANPAMGIRIGEEHIAREYASMGRDAFRRERLGVGDWPSEGDGWEVISEEAWTALLDPASEPAGTVAFALDVAPGQTMGSIAVAGTRDDGLMHLEIVENRPGTGWMVERAVDLVKKWRPCAVVIDSKSPAAALIPDLEAAKIKILTTSASEMVQACGGLYAGAVPKGEDTTTVRHRGQGPLNAAVAAATKRKIGRDGSWAWARHDLGQDISPLVAVTLAAYGYSKKGRRRGRARASWA
jgi:hypothetical protein